MKIAAALAVTLLLACGGEEDDDLNTSLEQSVSTPPVGIAPPSTSPDPGDDGPYTPPAPSGWCGDGKCSSTETKPSCPKDCLSISESFCGDGVCSSSLGESCAKCPKDCGSCCGNGKCDYGESCSSCPKDCGGCCGNGACDASESSLTCPSDCATTSCGNGRWDFGEDCDLVDGRVRAGVFGGPVTWGPTCADFALNGEPYCAGTLRCIGCKFVTSGCRLSEGPCLTAAGDYGCRVGDRCYPY